METLFSANPFGFFSLKTWQPSPIKMAKVSTRIFSKLKRGTVEDGNPNLLADYCRSLISQTTNWRK
jgi:hypothetical protein